MKPIRPSKDFDYPKTDGQKENFKSMWFENYEWLEYSVSKNSAFCFTCRMFGSDDESPFFSCHIIKQLLLL